MITTDQQNMRGIHDVSVVPHHWFGSARPISAIEKMQAVWCAISSLATLPMECDMNITIGVTISWEPPLFSLIKLMFMVRLLDHS